MTALGARFVGGALLVLAGALLGQQKLTEAKRRLACLRALAAALGRLEGELETLQSPLDTLFAHLADCPFFALVSVGFGTAPLETLWRRAAQAQPIGKEEQAVLAALGGVLGRTGAQRQAGEIALARRRLTQAADALEREIAVRARRFPPLGAALGAILAAVLF